MNMLFYVLSALPTGEEPPRSLFERIWLYFRGSSVFYPSLGMDDYDVMTARFVAVGLFVGVAIAVFMTVFNKRVLGDIVRGFIKKGVFSPDTALTLDQMGLADSFVARFVVKRSTSLRRVVKCREEEQHIASLDVRRTEYENRRKNGEKLPKFKEVEYKVNVLSDSFYIPEDMKHMAEVKFDKKGTTWIGAAVITVIVALISTALVVFMPQIFELIDGLVKTLGN